MTRYHSIIIGGTGQVGIILKNHLTKKKKKVVITSRFSKKKIQKKLFKIDQLNIYNKKKIESILRKYKPSYVFYFAGQSSPKISFKRKKDTIKSNYLGCKNVLEAIFKVDKNISFFNAASSEMFGHLRAKINVDSPKNPINPYGFAKLKSFNITKFYRERYKLKAYNAIFFNTESHLRKKSFFIPKVCLAAINAYKKGIKTNFGNINIYREWNWCEDQCELLIKFMKKKPQDFILSNGKCLSAKKIIQYAFEYFKLDYKEYISINKKYFRPSEVKIKKSNYLISLTRNKISKKNFVFGRKMINKLIENYLK